jgi:CheY-like chemotaxis protein
LLVEDHVSTRQLLGGLLKQRGHLITTAGSLAEAFHAAKEMSFDVVVSDLGLPDGTGWDLMKRLHAAHPTLPGIALSGYGMETDVQQTREAGFSAHLVKPVSMEKLQSTLDWLEEKMAAAPLD